jgi:hypothetical protein
LFVGIYPGDFGLILMRVGLVVVAFYFVQACPAFNDDELAIDPKGRAWQALTGVAVGALTGIARAYWGHTSPWAGTEALEGMLKLLAHGRLGPVPALIEYLPLLVIAGVIEAIVYGGMTRWVMTRPRGPLHVGIAAPIVALLYAWMHFCVPHMPDFGVSIRDLPIASGYAAVAFVNGLAMCLATHRTRSPLLAGSYIGVQWWVCLAFMYVVGAGPASG